jgi:tetratricopeptide (TPR) repeat protein
VDAANAAFVEHFSAVLCKCVDLFLSKSGSGGRSVVDALALFDRNRLALLQLFSFGRNAMSQPRAVRRALMRMLDKGLQLMDLLEVRVRTWELVELWSGMWLCAWTMPRTKRNARRLGVASLCLSRSLYLMDGGDDSVAAAEYGLNLIQRVTARSMRLDGVVAGGGGAGAGVGADHTRRSMPRRMVRDGALVADALGAVANVLSEDKRAEAAMNAGVKVEYERLLLYASERLAVMKRAFNDRELQTLELTNNVFLHLPAMWTQNSELAKLLGPSVTAAAAAADGSRAGVASGPQSVLSPSDRVPLGPVVALPPPSTVSDRVPGTEGTAAFAFASLDRVPLPGVPSVRGSDGETWEPAKSDPVKRIDRALLLYCQCLLTRMLYLGTNCRDYASTWYNIGNTLADRGLKYVALVAYKRSRMVDEAVLCRDHPAVARTVSSEAAVWHDLGKHDDALVLYKACLSMRERVLGARHLDVARTLSYIAIVLHAQGKFWTALSEFEQCYRIRSEQLGVHPDVAATLNNRAIVVNKLVTLVKKEADEPVPKPVLGLKDVQQAYERCLAIRRETLGHIHPDVAHSLDNLAVVCFKLSDRDRAVRELGKCIEVQQKLGKLLDVAKSKFKLGVMLVAADEDKAFESFKSCLETRRSEGPLHADVRATLRDVTAVFHLQLAKRESSLMRRSMWLDMQMQTLTDISAALLDKSFKASASAPRLGVPVYRYVVDASELAPRGATTAPGGAGGEHGDMALRAAAASTALVDADVATNMVGIGQTLVTLLSGMNAHAPHMLDAASRCTLQGVAVAELQVREKLDSRMAKDLALARINAGDVFMRRGAYADAAWEYSLAVELVRPIAETVKPMYVDALLGCAEAVVRTDSLRALNLAKEARRVVADADWSRFGRRLALLANRILLWDNAAVEGHESWLNREDVLALGERATVAAAQRIS